MYARLMPHWTGGAKITMSMYSGSSQTYHLWHPQTVNHRILVLCLFLASASTETLGTRKCRREGGYSMATDRHVEGRTVKSPDELL